ncbi:MAG TPA: fatty acyl-AMP ligase [Mycobacterium sp.]|nr:fatty acyl-AMP ligase [Mycobacterium sp.]
METLGFRGRLKTDDYLDGDGSVVLPDGTNLGSFLDRNIAGFSDALAYRYIDYTQNPDGEAVELTWGQVGAKTKAIAARLQQVCDRGDRVAILAPDGVDYVVGFLAAIIAGNIAVPLFPPDLPGHAERLEAVIGDAAPAVVLTTAGAGAAVGEFVRTIPRSDRPRVIAVDAVPESVGATFAPVGVSADDTAYLQYTSGSTRTPTGVEISHRAAGTNVVQMGIAIGLDDWDTHGVSWLPLYHDMGLLMVIFPVVSAEYATLMSPMAFVRRPQRWIRALAAESRHGRVVAPAPNFAFDLIVQRGLPADGEAFDLSNVVLINGSEPVSIDSIAAFNKALAKHGLPSTAVKPSYGMAEATLFVSTIDLAAEPSAAYLDREQLAAGHAVRVAPDTPNAVARVSCGRVARSQWAAIVDPETEEELADAHVGEIWLHGNNIGSGYWASPEETARVFGNKLRATLPVASRTEGSPAGAAWLRTGDLGVYLDGELYVTGRIKDVIILDGRNHYPQDIEATVAAASPAVRAGYVAAFSVTADELPGGNGTGERLVVVAERATAAGRVEAEPVVAAIRAAVSQRHGLAVADVRLVAAGSIPRTTSGKLAHRACREHYLRGRFGTSSASRR